MQGPHAPCGKRILAHFSPAMSGVGLPGRSHHGHTSGHHQRAFCLLLQSTGTCWSGEHQRAAGHTQQAANAQDANRNM